MCLAATEDAVEKREEALLHELGQRLRDGSADDFAPAHEVEVGRVRHLDDVGGPAQDRHCTGRLVKHFAQPLELLLGCACRRTQASLSLLARSRKS
jgi:hypothetical protein